MGKRGRSGIFRQVEQWLNNRTQHRRYEHIFQGHTNMAARPRPAGSGFHHRFLGENPPGARVRRDANGKELILETDVTGTYRARVDTLGPDGNWHQKKGSSTFFPDNWTPQRVDESIEEAFRNGNPHPKEPGKWVGTANGLQIQGFYNESNPNFWYSAWPIIGEAR
ncbi:EndoU domain-containing protein [Actinoplanes sp. NPDC051851]|uniref:EndoU domain-containing protein n=1 Tax=Actinoplanes sp. NPDC051851 TaxID=3154753 RepID=UPI00341B9566